MPLVEFVKGTMMYKKSLVMLTNINALNLQDKFYLGIARMF